MTVRYRPKAPRGTHWEGAMLVGDSGYLEMSHEVLLVNQAQCEIEDGAPVVDGKVRATFWVEVEEVPCTS